MTETKKSYGNKWMPVMYANYYGILLEVARECGYALAVHGSLNRDLDLIAVPWIKDCKTPDELLHRICAVLGSAIRPDGRPSYNEYEEKPHGRVAFAILTNGGGYIDISIIKPTF